MCHKLVANWSRMFYTCFKILCEFFNQNISQECCESVANLSPRNFGKLNFTMQNFGDTCTIYRDFPTFSKQGPGTNDFGKNKTYISQIGKMDTNQNRG